MSEPDEGHVATDRAADEAQIRDLITRWATAVHEGDLDAVLDHHATDIVMFDVPPPEDGIRGIDAYAACWPPFLEFQASGATFDILELDVTAGGGVAYAWALLRCGPTQENADDPGRRLRLTLGFRDGPDGWLVTHEHHSFTQP